MDDNSPIAWRLDWDIEDQEWVVQPEEWNASGCLCFRSLEAAIDCLYHKTYVDSSMELFCRSSL